MTTLSEFAELARGEQGLAVVATVRADASIQSSVVNLGVLEHPVSGEAVVGFVTYGKVKLGNLRARNQVNLAVRAGWQWAAVEGQAEIIGPDDPHPAVDAERLRLLLREIFRAAGGTHDDWDEYDRVMVADGRAAVLVTPQRVYGS
ncbi:TIGR03618 family F420-dependent PPOX class oxidoreductase [Kribbella lupini]|uniref:TIGR03618 family F420-dependent PPOX class oxidoreductase n=1 Tax=Kribbella lupini TaxID=291602 RepID=UPI0031CDDC56